MAIYFNKKTLESELLDTINGGIIAENFTYLLNNLIDFVDPQYTYSSVNLPDVKGGQRRMLRAMRGTKLGYAYRTAASKSSISSRGTKIIKAFGQDIRVEEWTVSHPHAEDPELGEVYPAQDPAVTARPATATRPARTAKPAEPRGPYTCLITARISLSKKEPTRCYVQCNCKDFDTTFYDKLNKEEYTNAKDLPDPTGAKELAPALCKHLFAIYSKYYTELVTSIEHFQINQSPVLFGPTTTPPPVPPTAIPTVAKDKDTAIKLIKQALKKEFQRLKNDPEAYFDTRGKGDGGGSYHLHPFSVTLLNGNNRAIAYRNKTKAPITTSGRAIKLLDIPHNPKIWALFPKWSDQKVFWDYIRELGQMPKQMQDAIAKKQGYGVHMESVEPETVDFTCLTENSSSILSSISELN